MFRCFETVFGVFQRVFNPQLQGGGTLHRNCPFAMDTDLGFSSGKCKGHSG